MAFGLTWIVRPFFTMRIPAPTLPPGQPEPQWLRRALFVERVSLGMVLFVSVGSLAAWLFPEVGDSLPLAVTQMNIPMAVAAQFCALSLMMTERGTPLLLRRLSRAVAVAPGVIAAAILVGNLLPFASVKELWRQGGQGALSAGSLSPLSATAFLFLSIVMLLALGESRLMRRVADVFVFCLGVFTLVLLSQDLFGAFGLFGLTAADLISAQVLFCLALLTVVVTLRQAEDGVFAIFLGGGIGSRIARGFAPVLLLWPFVREVGETQIGFQQLIPAHFATSVLTALAVAISLVFLLFLTWRITEMETDIHDLTLRDDLTGLYNMRGFYLLGEQTLRLSQRAQLPFSVLFLDLDGLKQINDQLGHNTGSAYLKETGELIFEGFREGDVKGRFGGDEFVVAGQFSMVGIEIAAQRLGAAAAERSAAAGRRFPLSFSIGHVTAEYYSTETLKELVARADKKMYEAKREKKAGRM